MDEIRRLILSGELPTLDKISKFKKQFKNIKASKCVEIIKQYDQSAKKFEVIDFVEYFRQRLDFLRSVLLSRPETESAISISKAPLVHGECTIIGIISEITQLPSGALKLTVEDQTGSITAILSSKNQNYSKLAPFLIHDDVLAFKGRIRGKSFFISDLIWPDIPHHQKPVCEDDVWLAFTGDLHIGSNMFLHKESSRFLAWLNGKYGSTAQRELAKKVKYIFMVGDIVDGVGIYPEQQDELYIKDIYTQYEEAAKFLSQIPEDKEIIICPGNHDAVRLCEPQPPFYKDIAKPLYELDNVTIVSNPAIVRIHKMDEFPGWTVLLYHGYSFDYYVDTNEYLRLAGGYDRPDKLIEFLLKRRHLAPTYGSSLTLPLKDDPLLIKTVPDIVTTGHIHKAMVSNYKGVSIVSSSCWQARTTFQERVGHHPDPSKLPLINMSDNSMRLLAFG